MVSTHTSLGTLILNIGIQCLYYDCIFYQQYEIRHLRMIILSVNIAHKNTLYIAINTKIGHFILVHKLQ